MSSSKQFKFLRTHLYFFLKSNLFYKIKKIVLIFYGKVLHCMVLVSLFHGLTTSLVKSKFLYAVFFLIDDGVSRFELAITQVYKLEGLLIRPTPFVEPFTCASAIFDLSNFVQKSAKL